MINKKYIDKILNWYIKNVILNAEKASDSHY